MATPPTKPGDLTPKETFLAEKTYIERVIAQSCRKSKFGPEDTKDFGQHVLTKLVCDGYRVIRKFRQDNGATLRTYLATVIKRTLYDYQDHIWGKYRPSAVAIGLGPIAVRLETLLVRDECSFEEACAILRTNEGVEMSVEELDDLRAKLPLRVLPKAVDTDSLEIVPSPEPQPLEKLLKKERDARRRRIYMRLKEALDTLPTDDHLLVKLWLQFSLAEIARIRKIEQKPLYRRMGKIFNALREALERRAVRREDLTELLAPLKEDLYAQPKRGNG
jgi:RNA polymerase sigma factor (sigma-70 family)